MKIKELQMSNILSFKHYENIIEAPKLIFDQSLNILIGENGSGKSTALEAINFVLKRVLFTQFNLNEEIYNKRNSLSVPEKQKILTPVINQTYSGFRLEPNWDTENKPQKIRLIVKLDEIDTANIKNLISSETKLADVAAYTKKYSSINEPAQDEYILEITLNNKDKKFTIDTNSSDFGYSYLKNYNLYKELIKLYNRENSDKIKELYESFVLIGGYRNYSSFTSLVSITKSPGSQQKQEIITKDYSKSLNTSEQSLPGIFDFVALTLAEFHYNLGETGSSPEEKEENTNNEPFLKHINDKLKLIKLECKIRLSDRRHRQYAFEFIDTQRKKVLNDINSLSSGQKALIHLLFEAYGHGELKGGVVIIDEPEIHLHCQFQDEYVRIITEINKEQKCQYILVTHSGMWNKDRDPLVLRLKIMGLDGLAEVKRWYFENKRALVKASKACATDGSGRKKRGK